MLNNVKFMQCPNCGQIIQKIKFTQEKIYQKPIIGLQVYHIDG